MAERDDAAAAYYEDPAHRKLSGPAVKRQTQSGRLVSHVPVRFSAAMIDRVKELAADDGKTVSSWIRDVVEREVVRRERPVSVGWTPTITWTQYDPDALAGSGTIASSVEDLGDLERMAS